MPSKGQETEDVRKEVGSKQPWGERQRSRDSLQISRSDLAQKVKIHAALPKYLGTSPLHMLNVWNHQAKGKKMGYHSNNANLLAFPSPVSPFSVYSP